MNAVIDRPHATGTWFDGKWIEGLRRLPTEAELPHSDGEVLETQWHRDVMLQLIDCANYHFRDRNDWWCGGDMFLYFNLDMVKSKDFRGPDFFFVKGVEKRSRLSYVVWEEGGHFPNVIIETISESTRDKDLGEKKVIYERVFETPEYFVVEPDRQTMLGWRLENGRYQAIAPVNGRLRCEQLGLDLGFWEGEWIVYRDIYPRFFYPDGRLVPTFREASEAERDAERRNAEAERQKTEAERQKTEAAIRQVSEATAINAALVREIDALKAKLAEKSS